MTTIYDIINKDISLKIGSISFDSLLQYFAYNKAIHQNKYPLAKKVLFYPWGHSEITNVF